MCIWGRLILVAHDRFWRITPPINQGLLENPVALHDYPTWDTASVSEMQRLTLLVRISNSYPALFVPGDPTPVLKFKHPFRELGASPTLDSTLFGRHMTSVAGTCWLGPYSNPGTPSGVAYHALNWNWRTTRFEGNSCRHSCH